MNMQTASSRFNRQYAQAMGHLLVLYTQVDQFIMEACADRVSRAPSDEARCGLAKQVGDECRHVDIQRRWMREFGVDETPVVSEQSLKQLHSHFRSLDWVDFLTDLYVGIEALGSQAVEQLVPLADPGTRESLRVPLEDELDHVEFGLTQLTKALQAMNTEQRLVRIQNIPGRVHALFEMLSELGLPLAEWFEAVGSDYENICAALETRKDDLLGQLVA